MLTYQRHRHDIIPVHRYLVELAAKRIIEEIEYEKDKLWEALIEEKMNKRWFPCKTREKAIKSIEKEVISIFSIGPSRHPDDYRIREYYVAEELLDASKITDDIMYLDVETANLVSQYVE